MQLATDSAKVTVHATVTDLGCSFGGMALALGAPETISARAIAGPTRLSLSGEAAEDPTTVGLSAEEYPTVRSLRALLDSVGASQVGLHLQYAGRIPPASGLGSRSAKILAGLLIGRQLLGNPDGITDRYLATLATDLGADRLRISALMNGPLALSVPLDAGNDPIWCAAVNARISPVGFVPSIRLGRAPKAPQKPRVAYFDDAARASARAAVLVAALVGGGVGTSRSGGSPSNEKDAEVRDDGATDLTDEAAILREQLVAGTGDDLRWDEVSARLPASAALTDWLRELGLPAFVSGDGPAVVSLVRPRTEVLEAAQRSGWRVIELACNRESPVETQ